MLAFWWTASKEWHKPMSASSSSITRGFYRFALPYNVDIRFQLDQESDYESVTIEKNNAKRLIDQILAGFQQILSLRSELKAEYHDQFDMRLDPIRLQIQSTVNALNTLIAKPLSQKPTSRRNMFDDCFDDEPAASTSIYEEEMAIRSTQKSAYVEELRLKAEQAKADAEATKKLSEVGF